MQSSIYDFDAIHSNMGELGLRCQSCDTPLNVSRRRQNTQYVFEGEEGSSEDPNYVTLCNDCHVINDDYWEDMWQEYYRGCL